MKRLTVSFGKGVREEPILSSEGLLAATAMAQELMLMGLERERPLPQSLLSLCKYLRPGSSEQEWLERAVRESSRVQISVSLWLAGFIRLEAKFYRKRTRKPFYSLELGFGIITGLPSTGVTVIRTV